MKQVKLTLNGYSIERALLKSLVSIFNILKDKAMLQTILLSGSPWHIIKRTSYVIPGKILLQISISGHFACHR